MKLHLRNTIVRNTIVRNALSLYGIQAANYILPFFTFPYLARVLGPERMGDIFFAQAFITYFQVVTEYGFNYTATREISIHRDNREKLSVIFTATLAAKAILMLGSLAVMLAIVFAVPRLRAEAPLFCVTFMVVIANVVFPVWLFQGIEKMQNITYREIGARLIGLAPTFLFVHKPSDYIVAASIQTGSMLAAGAVGYIGFARLTTARLTRITLADLRHTFAEGWHVFLSTAAITLYTKSNTVILGFADKLPADVGYFTMAQRPIDAGRSLVFPMAQAIFPHVSRLSHHSPEAAAAFMRRNTRRLMLPFILVSVGLFAGSFVIVGVLGGSKYAPSVPLLRVMAPIPLAVAISAVYATQYMLGMGFKKEWSRLIISAGGFNFIVLVPMLFFMRATYAVAITSVLVEVWVAAGAYLFFRYKLSHTDRTTN